jgi:phosphoribosylformimino-5-aminoimidazole carboxamide ribotide isomerase
MQVIPVIDLRRGVVVHATGGNRDGYRPIETPLAPGTSDPVAVVGGLLAVHPFRTLYVADLDGIGGKGRNHDTICALGQAFPGLDLWVDEGRTVARPSSETGRVTQVTGSETLVDLGVLEGWSAADRARAVLSLDFKGEALVGPVALIDRPQLWPERVIAMTLASVGAGAGPDLGRVRDIVRQAGPGRAVFAAGGVRERGDLAALAAAGAAGVLVASALHAGKLKAGDLVASKACLRHG